MSSRKVEVPKVGLVLMSRRRGMKNIRVSISPSGVVKVNMPSWTPYRLAERFVVKHVGWINEKRQAHQVVIRPGDIIGRNIKVIFKKSSQTEIKISPASILVRSPKSWDSAQAQTHLKNAADKALKNQSEAALPKKVSALSQQHGLKFNKLRVKRLMSRWGSCSTKNDISLSIYLIQLPDELIDYVIVHELVHTKHRYHGRVFWSAMESYLPESKNLRKKLRKYSPMLKPRQSS